MKQIFEVRSTDTCSLLFYTPKEVKKSCFPLISFLNVSIKVKKSLSHYCGVLNYSQFEASKCIPLLIGSHFRRSILLHAWSNITRLLCQIYILDRKNVTQNILSRIFPLVKTHEDLAF